MKREQALAILYELAILIGGETRVAPLLRKFLQRLLYHTSFPCGLIFLDPETWSSRAPGEEVVARLDLAIGDLDLVRLEGQSLAVPAALLRGGAGLVAVPDGLRGLPVRDDHYRAVLRLPIDGCGVILLLTPEAPESPIPLERLFEPILRNLGHAVALCRGNEAFEASLLDQRASAEAALADLSHRSELVLAAVGEGICGVDPRGIVTFVNPMAARLLGFAPEALVGRPLHHVIVHRKRDQSEIPADRCPLMLAMKDGQSHRTEEDTFRRRDGTDFPVDYVCTPLRAGDRVVGAVVVFRDITERRQAERELQRLNRTLETMIRCNQSVVHARDEVSLLSEVCSALTEIGGHTLAWVGYAESDRERSLRAVAAAGRDDGYLTAFPLAWSETCSCPFGIAVRGGETSWVADLRRGTDRSLWRVEALRRGLDSCVALPIHCDGRVLGTLVVFDAEPDSLTHEEVSLLEELAGDLSFGIAMLRTREERDRALAERASHLERLHKVAVETVQAMSAITELRDPYTAGHQRRVAEIAVAIAREMGLPAERIEGIHFGSLIHDIGKMYVPAEFLNRSGRLTTLEMQIIRTHAEAGYAIVKDIDFPWPVAEMIRQHHEALDGSGYPQGLKGEEILLESRILAVADALEAMCTHRPYRAARGMEVALAEIRRLSGALYDPAVVRACLALYSTQHPAAALERVG